MRILCKNICYSGWIAFRVLFGLLLAAGFPALAQTTHPPIGGIYLVATAKRLIGQDKNLDKALANPSVDGAYISLNWDSIEPVRGQFNWAAMDAEMARVTASHKKASLAVVPGQYTPDWVYQAGARHFDSVVEPELAGDYCDPIKMPLPWDPVYLAAWKQFIRAFGAHYANNPALSMIKITGVSYRTDETSLPFGTYAHLPPDRIHISPKTGKACVIPDDMGEWQRYGYTWQKADNAFEQITRAFMAAFPGVPMGIMTSDHSFPPLSKDGRRPDPAGYALSTNDFFSIGRRLMGTKFVGQFNGLTANQVNAGLVAFSATNPTAYQTGMPSSHGEPLCVMNNHKHPCEDRDVFLRTVNQALNAHAVFIEMFYDDINNPALQDILQQTQQRLKGALTY